MIPKFRAWDKETKTMNGMAADYRNAIKKLPYPREEKYHSHAINRSQG